MYLVVDEGDVVLVDGVPLLQHDLVPLGAGLRRDQLLQVSYGVVLVALDANLRWAKKQVDQIELINDMTYGTYCIGTYLLSQPVVHRYLNHDEDVLPFR